MSRIYLSCNTKITKNFLEFWPENQLKSYVIKAVFMYFYFKLLWTNKIRQKSGIILVNKVYISKIKNPFLRFYNLFPYTFSSQNNLPYSVKEPVEILRDGVQVDNEDLESEDLTIEFDFNAIEKSKSDPAKSFEHCALAHKKKKEILVEPLVAAYLNLKWQSLKGWWYGYRVLFFLAFGVCLTFMISFIVEMNSTCTYSTTDNIKISQYNSELVKKFHAIFDKSL